MKRTQPKKLRDRRTGLSSYQRHQKRPYVYPPNSTLERQVDDLRRIRAMEEKELREQARLSRALKAFDRMAQR